MSLRERAWAAAAEVCDPEVPVLTIADLGVLREVTEDGAGVEVSITPTYSGCAAMGVIAMEVELALADLDCREETDYTDRSTDIARDAEQQFVDDHRSELEAMKAAAEQE